MKLKIFLIVLVSLILASFSFPNKYEVYNEWDHVSLVDTLYTSQVGDTVLAICSNRNFDPGRKEFLGHVSNADHSINYFVATFKKGNWLIDKVEGLSTVFKYLSQRDLVIYAEGMGKTLPLNLQRASGMTAQYNLNVLLFDYPSIHPDKSIFSNFYFAYNHAKDAHQSFGIFLNQFSTYHKGRSEYFQDINSSLFFHSMGNQILKQTIVHHNSLSLEQNIFDNVVLNAACVPRRDHNDWIENITFSDRIYIHYNKQDKQLNGASLITLDKMLGVNPGKNQAENAVYVDFNELVGNRHSNFLNIDGRDDIEEEARQYYAAVLHGHAPHINDSNWFVTNDKSVYVLRGNN